MKLSEHIALLTKLMEEHGDVVIMKLDYTQGECDVDTPTITKILDGVAVSAEDYEQRFSKMGTREDKVAEMESLWERLGRDMQQAWGSHERFMQEMMRSYDYNAAVVARWPNEPYVIVV